MAMADNCKVSKWPVYLNSSQREVQCFLVLTDVSFATLSTCCITFQWSIQNSNGQSSGSIISQWL